MRSARFPLEVNMDFISVLAFGRLAELAVIVIFFLVTVCLLWAIYRKLTDAVVLLQFIRDHIHKDENPR